ncbi:MAG: class I SAM-dependent methyltransferase [Bacteroidales bacterium]
MELLRKCPVCESELFDPFLSGTDYFLTHETFEIVKCRNCGFRLTNPRPEARDLGKYYESTEYISHSNKQKGLFASVYQLVRKYTLGRKLALIKRFQEKGEILDIGCATGQFLHFMSEKGWKTTGIEPDDKTRAKAISEYDLNVFPEEGLNTFPKASFDVITMWHVLEHVSELNTRMIQLKNLLKSNGTLFIAVPNYESYDAKIYGKFWAGYDLPRHLYHFAKSDIKLLADKNGFKIVEILPMKFDAFYVSLLSEKYKSGKMRWLPAFWNGLLSNLKASPKFGYSSQTYVLKAK